MTKIQVPHLGSPLPMGPSNILIPKAKQIKFSQQVKIYYEKI